MICRILLWCFNLSFKSCSVTYLRELPLRQLPVRRDFCAVKSAVTHLICNSDKYSETLSSSLPASAHLNSRGRVFKALPRSSHPARSSLRFFFNAILNVRLVVTPSNPSLSNGNNQCWMNSALLVSNPELIKMSHRAHGAVYFSPSRQLLSVAASHLHSYGSVMVFMLLLSAFHTNFAAVTGINILISPFSFIHLHILWDDKDPIKHNDTMLQGPDIQK